MINCFFTFPIHSSWEVGSTETAAEVLVFKILVAVMDWSSPRNIATSLLSSNPIAILITAVIAITLPILFHLFLYLNVVSESSTYFLLLGPSGAGKTSLLSLVSSPATFNAHVHKKNEVNS
jgi:hypothetical protein